MMRAEKNSTWKKVKIPRGKHHNKTATKTTVSLYLNKNLVERARNRCLNLSRVAEQALSSILDYLEPQNKEASSIESSEFLSFGSFPKERNVPRAGFGTTINGDISRNSFPFFYDRLGFSLLLGYWFHFETS